MDKIAIALTIIYNESIRSIGGKYYKASDDTEIDTSLVQSEIDAEILKIDSKAECEPLLKYLADTDWIVVKIYETVLSGDQDEADILKEKYATDLTNRKDARALINSYEDTI
jgi:hypothetical protein